jgi:predicted SprT family Zn-dependent metalloprotease
MTTQTTNRLPNRTDSGTIRALIKAACEANGVGEIAHRIIVKWSNRYTNCMGKALYRSEWDMCVTFSVPLWPRADEDERRQTIIHEACHIIARYKHQHLGGQPRIAPHGWQWKQAMQRSGIQPKRCHKVDTTGLKRRTKKFFYNCACMTHEVGAMRHKRLQAGMIYTCRKCKTNLRNAPVVTTIGPMKVAAL